VQAFQPASALSLSQGRGIASPSLRALVTLKPVNAAPAASANLYCISCGYNQRGITAAHCPECGQDFSILPPSPSRLPWLHRRRVGLFRAYWRTVGMFLFNDTLFREQAENPITLRDAHLFCLLTLAHVIAPPLILLIYLAADQPPGRLMALKLKLFASDYIPAPEVFYFLVGYILFFIAATGMPSYFCHPRALPVARQNTAIAFSYFSCAPLALVPIFFILVGVAEYFAKIGFLWETLRIVAAALMVCILPAWYIRTAALVLVLSQRRRRVLTVLLLTTCWIAALVLFLIIVPLALWYASVMLRIIF